MSKERTPSVPLKVKKNSYTILLHLDLYLSFLNKLLPIAIFIGFLPILIYFQDNNFIPNVDIIGWTSILYICFIRIAILFISITTILVVAGFLWKDYVTKTDLILENKYIKLYREDFYFLIGFYSQLLLIFTYYYKMKYFFYLLFFIVSLLSTIIIFSKPTYTIKNIKKNFFDYLFHCVIICFLFICYDFSLFLIYFLIYNEPLKTFLINYDVLLSVCSLLLMSFIFITIQKEKYKSLIMIYISLFVILAIFTDRFNIISANLVKNMNMGNYSVEQLQLTPKTCQQLQLSLTPLPITEHCTLENVKMIWSLGNEYILEIKAGDDLEKLFLERSDIIQPIKIKKQQQKETT